MAQNGVAPEWWGLAAENLQSLRAHPGWLVLQGAWMERRESLLRLLVDLPADSHECLTARGKIKELDYLIGDREDDFIGGLITELQRKARDRNDRSA